MLTILVCLAAAGCDDHPPWNDAPSVGEVTAGGAYGALEVRLAFTVADENGDPLTCSIDRDGDGQFEVALPCAGEVAVDVEYDRPGFYEATVRAEDPAGRNQDRELRIRVPFEPPIAALQLVYEEATLMSTVAATAWSPDGARVATGDAQGIRVWDPVTGERLARWETGQVAAAAWNPDGTRLGVLRTAGALTIHDGTDGALTVQLGTASAFAWSPDGVHVLAGGPDASLRVLAAADGALVANLTGHLGAITAVSWSPDGTRLASAGGGELRWWRDDTNGLYAEIATAAAPDVRALAWSPDGQTLAAAGPATIATWTRDGDPLAGVIADAATALAYSPDGTRLAAAGETSQVRVHDLATGTSTPLVGHAAVTDAIAWSPDGTRLASGGHDAALRIWDPAVAAETLAVAQLPPFRAVAWSADGTRLAVREGDAKVTLREPGGAVVRVLAGNDHANQLAWRPDGTRLAVSSIAGDVVIADTATGAVVQRLPTPPVAIAWGAEWLAISDDAGRILAWNPDTGQLGRTLALPWGAATSLSWSAGDALASLRDDDVHVWDVDAGTIERSDYVAEGRAVAWSPGDELLALVGDQRLRLVGEDYQDDFWIPSTATLSWDPLAGRVAIGAGPDANEPGAVGILDLASRAVVTSIPVAEVASWSPDGELLAVGSVAGRLAIYRVVYDQ